MSGTVNPADSSRPRGWPSTADYNEAVQDLSRHMFDDELRAGTLALTPLGMPALWSGGFADVYRVDCPATGNAWAIKCFTRGAAGLGARYHAISQRLDELRLPFMVDFRYLAEGIRTARGVFPIVKMRWIEGRNLNQFVGESLDQPAMLDQLFTLWIKLAARLHEAGIAHADLQHGNVLLVPRSDRGHVSLKLIDYDGMFVPALAGRLSGESGLAAYQHPWRQREGIYSPAVDRFSHLVICTAVRALRSAGRPLWDRFNNGENLLFRESDFTSPGDSPLLRELWTLRQSDVRALAGRLALACQRPVHETPLVSDLVEGRRVRELTSAEQLAATALLAPRATTPSPPTSAIAPAVSPPAAPPFSPPAPPIPVASPLAAPPRQPPLPPPVAKPLAQSPRALEIVDAELVSVAPASPPRPVFPPPAPNSSTPGASASNPWTPPASTASSPFMPLAPRFDYARRQVAGPAIALMLFAIFGAGIQFLFLIASLTAASSGRGTPGDEPPPVIILTSGASILVGALTFLGGLKMKALRSHTLATFAAAVAMLPCISPCCIVGLPVGIWALTVLNDSGVKAAFR